MKSLKLYILDFLLTTSFLSLCNATPFENLKAELAKSNTQALKYSTKQSPSFQKSATFGALCATASTIFLTPASKNLPSLLGGMVVAGLTSAIFYHQKNKIQKKIGSKKGLIVSTVLPITFTLLFLDHYKHPHFDYSGFFSFLGKSMAYWIVIAPRT